MLHRGSEYLILDLFFFFKFFKEKGSTYIIVQINLRYLLFNTSLPFKVVRKLKVGNFCDIVEQKKKFFVIFQPKLTNFKMEKKY